MHLNMDLDYTITEFNESGGQIIVLCNKTGQSFAIDLPIDNGKFPEGADLDIYIRGFLPSWVTERAVELQTGVTNGDSIRNLIPVKTQLQQDIDIGRVVRMERHRLLSQTDWTQLPDSPFSDQEKEDFKIYRQALRDITKDLDNVIWPTLPMSNI